MLPDEVRQEVLVVFLTRGERAALALTCRDEARWLRPILAFMALPMNEKMALARSGVRSGVVVLEALSQCHDHVALLSLLGGLKCASLREGVRKIIEDRIRDRSYRKLIKKTLIRMYLSHYHGHVEHFLATIRSPEVLSQAIEQHILLHKNNTPAGVLMEWAARIPDPLTRHRFLNHDS